MCPLADVIVLRSRMRQQGDSHLSRSNWNPLAPAVGNVPNFEVVYDVPAAHTLVAVRSRSRGGLERAEYWMHEEYDEGGRLVARYESYEELGAASARRSGWCKFDPDGQSSNR